MKYTDATKNLFQIRHWLVCLFNKLFESILVAFFKRLKQDIKKIIFWEAVKTQSIFWLFLGQLGVQLILA